MPTLVLPGVWNFVKGFSCAIILHRVSVQRTETLDTEYVTCYQES